MKISLEWLRDYVDYQDTVESLEEILTGAGFPVEQRERIGDDWMLDVEITSNRPDCLGHIGLAREVATVTGAAFKLPAVDFTEHGVPAAERMSVENQAETLSRRYTARLIDDVNVGPAPDWMARRLETIGLRPINNVVDITNYVMMEIGQPLHSFDFARLAGGRIVVRQARPGEKTETIDHSQIELNETMLVIADAAETVAVAGIMGGLASEVGENTRCVLLESAHFDPLSIRRTSRTLSLGSESSFRFERNVDIVAVEWASRRAAGLLAEFAGGKIAPGVVDIWPAGRQSRQVELRLGRLKSLIGIDIEKDRVMTILGRLGFEPQLNEIDIVRCSVPSWRSDVYREVDLIEEVIRIHGYGHVPTEKKIHIDVKTRDTNQRGRRNIAAVLNGCGFFETINVSFEGDESVSLFAEDGFEPLRVKDVSRKSNNALRHTLLPSLLTVRRRNKDAGNGRCDIYEISHVQRPDDGQQLPQEKTVVGILTDGDFQELRGVVEAIVSSLDSSAVLKCASADVLWAAQGAGAEFTLNGKSLGWAGRPAENIKKAFDLEDDLCLAELDFDRLIELEGAIPQLKQLMRFPPITRDLSLVLDEAVSWAQIERTILAERLEHLQELNFVEIYRGKGIDPGKKSLTLSMSFRCAEST